MAERIMGAKARLGGGGNNGGSGPNDYTPLDCNPDPNYTVPTVPPPPGMDYILPCSELDIPVEIVPGPIDGEEDAVENLSASEILNSIFVSYGYDVDLSLSEAQSQQLIDFVRQAEDNENLVAFAAWVVQKISEFSGLDVPDFLTARTDYNEPPNIDPNNNAGGNYDTNTYQEIVDLQSPWENIPSVILSQDFIGWRAEDVAVHGLSCMDFSKEQLAKLGYTISNYYDTDGFGLPQTFQTYQNGVANAFELKKAISYIKYALSNGIPVIVGVDYKSGTSNASTDNTTDHFIVIVGMGNENGVNYLRYFDNAFSDTFRGAHSSNKLFYNPVTGVMQNKIKSDPSYTTGNFGIVTVQYDYIMTMVRKSKLKL
ncbi:C1 family peptidase [Parapedobacter composti]|nr:hypothetical protein [Parapedobacter composti]